MLRFYLERFVEAFHLFQALEGELELFLADSNKDHVEAFPTPVRIERAKFALNLIELQCNTMELNTQSALAKDIRRHLHADSQFFAQPLVKEMLTNLRLLRTSISNELERHLFVYVPISKAGYWQISGPFPKTFLPQAVKDTQWELDEAGNCYAAGRNTACIFHLMRLAEHELRMLAKKLRIALIHKGKTMPIEFADWNAIITGIKNKICAARKLSPGPRRQAKLDRYSNLADHCEYMKDIWRNNLAHARRPYNEQEAVAAFERVSAFVQTVNDALTSRSA